MLTNIVFPIIASIIWALFGVFLGTLILRMVFNYTDPNPFGAWGRFGFKVRKATEKWVYPATRFFAMYRIDTRLAPLLPMLIGLVLAYFALQILGGLFFIVDVLAVGIAAGSVKVIIGIALYAALSLLVLFIFIRFLSFWFVFSNKTFFAFVRRVTDPVLLPFQRLIPPIGMFDISAMIVLMLIGFLQSIVLRVFVYQ